MLQFKWYEFSQLKPEQLYDALALRMDVFILEQNCLYPDIDGKDKVALHLLGTDEGKLVAYIRLFPPVDIENYIVFGRVVTARSARTKGYGKQLVQEMFNYCEKNFPGVAIKCSAQYYLKKFYESFGLKAYGDIYLEDGIDHIAMRKG